MTALPETLLPPRDDILADWSADGAAWRQMRAAHLHGCPPELQVGVYACSPEEKL